MSIWWITLINTFIISIFARVYNEHNLNNNKPNKIFSLFAVLILIFVSGLRWNVGDTQTYIHHFEVMSSKFSDTLNTISYEGADNGFKILSGFIKAFITQDPQVYILILSAITIILIFIVLYKYCDMLEVGVFIFITLGNYLVSMNAVRQSLVAAILFSVFTLIYNRKWYIYIPIVLISATMHNSATIFILLYFIVNTEAWGKISKTLLFGGILSYLLYPITGRVIVGLLESTQYSVYGEGIITGSAGSSNIIRTLVYAVPVIFAYIKRDELKERYKYYNIFVNFSILNLNFMLLSNAASWIFARYCIYFSLYSIVLLCWCIKSLKHKKERRVVYYWCIVLFSIYYFYEMHISLNMIYESNFIKL